MALFKNIYLDLRFLNPFRNLKKKKEDEKQPAVSTKISNVPVQNNQPERPASAKAAPAPKPAAADQKRELPAISKKLLSKEAAAGEAKFKLPKIEKVAAAPSNTSNQEAMGTSHEEQKPMPAAILSNTRLSNSQTQSFFSNLQGHIMKESKYIHSDMPKDIIYNNLFTEMKSFWDDQKYNINKAVLDQAIKKDVADKIQELHSLEVEWQRLQLEHEKLKDVLASKEIIIENKIRQLKRTFKKIHLNAHTHQDHFFVLKNGQKLRSMQELADELEVMDDSVFSHHVNEQKNDFAAWINDVLNLKELSQNLVSLNNKKQMASLIRNWHEN